MTVYHSGLQKGGVHRKQRKKKVANYQSFIEASIAHTTGTVTTFGEMLSPKHPSVSGQVQRGLTAWEQARYQHAQGKGLSSMTKRGATRSCQGRKRTQTPGVLPSHLLSLPSPDPFRSFRPIHSPPPTHFCFLFLCSNVERKQVSKPQELLVVLWSAQTGKPKCITYNSGKIKKSPQNVDYLFQGSHSAL